MHKRFAVAPDKVAEWLALVGDEDTLPGVAGIGAKGATTLLDTYGSIHGAVLAIDEIKGRLGNALRAARDQLSVEIARARLDIARPLPRALAEATYVEPTAAVLNETFDRLGFVELLVSDGGAIRVEVCETADAVRAVIAGLAGPTAVHALLEDAGTLVGIALAVTGGEARYVPVGGAAWAALVPWLEDETAHKLGHDLVGTCVALRHAGVRLAGIVGDSACASHLTQPSNWAPHDLPLVAKHVLGRALPPEETVRGVGQKRKAWAALPVERAADAAGLFADTAAAVWSALAPTVDRALLAEYLALSDTLVRMELTGLIVEPAALDHAEQAFAVIEGELSTQIEGYAGHPFNINSTKQLGAVLFEELRLPIASHTKTGWSTATEALEKIEHAHPIVPLVIRWRLLRRTFHPVSSFRREVGRDHRRLAGQEQPLLEEGIQ